MKYGKICGFWLGTQKAVVVADFQILHGLLNRPECSSRPTWPPEVISLIRKGVGLSSGPTWTEMRKTTLHTLKDLGYGKSIMEDIVEEEIDNLLEHIDKTSRSWFLVNI